MKCVFCSGRLKSQKVTFVYDYDNDYFVIENIPAEVCAQCGEKTFSPGVTDEIIRLGKKRSRPVRTMQVPVFDYAIQSL